MWRLSDAQYGNAVRDLFPGVTVPEVPTPGRHRLEFVDVAGRYPVTGALTSLYRQAAKAVADQVVAGLDKLLACRVGEAPSACAGRFVDTFASRAFRRPLTTEDRGALLAVYGVGAREGLGEGVRLLVEAVLQAPSFLYRAELHVALGSYELASALSFFLFDSLPDAPLWAVAQDGSLAQPVVLAAQVDRLLALPRVQDNLVQVMQRWLGVRRVLFAEVDTASYTDFEKLRQPLVDEVGRFLGALVKSGGGLGNLLTSRDAELDRPLATYYGVTGAAATPTKVRLPMQQRAGILTRGAFVASMRPANRSVHRGLTVLRSLLCTDIPPPPDGLSTKPPAGDVRTERQFAEYRARQGTCGACHGRFDAIGLAFEHYDEFGRFINQRDGESVDSAGTVDIDGQRVSFDDVVQLSESLAQSPQVLRCASRQMLGYAIGAEIEDSCAAAVVDRVATERGSLTNMFRAIALDSLLRTRVEGN